MAAPDGPSKAPRAKFKPLPSHARLRELFDYDPETGVLTWRISTNNRVRPGAVVGCLNGGGHWVGHIDGTVYVLHRIIWCWMTGDDPLLEVDHENLIGPDNRWTNLRLATSSQNHGNVGLCRGKTRSNKSGYKGVNWDAINCKWVAKIGKGGIQYYLGSFDDPALASVAYMAKARELFGEFARAA